MLPKKGKKKSTTLFFDMETMQKDFAGSLKEQEAIDSHEPSWDVIPKSTFLYQQCIQWIIRWKKNEWKELCVWEKRMWKRGENNHVSRNRKWAFRRQGEWAESQRLILMFLVSNVTSLSECFLVADFSPLIKYDEECKEWGRQNEWGWGISTKLQGHLMF